MKTMAKAVVLMLLAAVTLGAWTDAEARRRKAAPPPTPLTEAGKALEAKYAEQLKALQAELKAAVPTIDEQKIAAYTEGLKAVKAGEAAVAAAQKNLAQIKKGHGLVGHAKGKWIGGADKGIAATKKKLAAAKSDAEREKLEKELANWQKNRQDGLDALKERQAFLDNALANKPKWDKQLAEAQEMLAKGKAQVIAAVESFGVDGFLASDKLDGKLAKFIVMREAKPRGLAAFAQQGKAHEKLVNDLLANEKLMVQMCVADGAAGGKYGRAMEIYSTIQGSSTKAGDGVLQRLALAIALEHASPRGQRNATGLADAPKHVDPVKRHFHFEKAYLNGELDPGFAGLSTWDLRMVVNGEEPDEILTWGREMLRNYRPDHISTGDYRWRYVAAVRTDIKYGSGDNKYDQPDLQFFQNILKNGGVCGRRAFFGRFILRAFGVPTTARPQPGHAALAHWTPDGWVVCLGGGWGAGWTKGRYGRDVDFLANTQARAAGTPYMQVKRAQWVGDVVGEEPVYGLHARSAPGFWYGISLYRQQQIIEESKAKTLDAVGTELGEANESNVQYEFLNAKITDADRKITVSNAGVITIPAAATSSPTSSTRKIVFMPSVLGGMQLHYNRTGGHQPFEYTFDAPAAGKYMLTARVVTPSWRQSMKVSANGGEPVLIDLPFTVGMWDTTKPVEVTLKAGKNVLKFTREGGVKGVSIRDFTLKPIK